MAIRLLGFGLAYLTAEVIGIVALGVTWLITGSEPERLRRATYAIQRTWAGFVFGAVTTIFGIRVVVDGIDAVTEPPFLLLARHTSIVDNLLPSNLITRPHGIRIRYVMKQELLWDPALDVAGNRLPNVFVRRGSGESEREVSAIRRLATTMGPDEAILIYPEGTRFSIEKLEAAKRRLGTGDREPNRRTQLRDLTAGLHSVLPPRVSGVVALLEGCAADVVVMAHRGLDGFGRVADIWRGGMVRKVVEVKFWRIASSEIPESRADRIAWLYQLWTELDVWVRSADPLTAEAAT